MPAIRSPVVVVVRFLLVCIDVAMMKASVFKGVVCKTGLSAIVARPAVVVPAIRSTVVVVMRFLLVCIDVAKMEASVFKVVVRKTVFSAIVARPAVIVAGFAVWMTRDTTVPEPDVTQVVLRDLVTGTEASEVKVKAVEAVVTKSDNEVEIGAGVLTAGMGSWVHVTPSPSNPMLHVHWIVSTGVPATQGLPVVEALGLHILHGLHSTTPSNEI